MIGLRKFRLVSTDARGRGTRDEFLNVTAWEAIFEALSSDFSIAIGRGLSNTLQLYLD